MATNIDKALYSNISMGIASEEPDIEIEVDIDADLSNI